MSGHACDVDNLTVCPIAEDTRWYKWRPNGAGERDYRMLKKEGYPSGWMVLCMDCYRKRREEVLSKGRKGRGG
jgi:hypothetical protein